MKSTGRKTEITHAVAVIFVIARALDIGGEELLSPAFEASIVVVIMAIASAFSQMRSARLKKAEGEK